MKLFLSLVGNYEFLVLDENIQDDNCFSQTTRIL